MSYSSLRDVASEITLKRLLGLLNLARDREDTLFVRLRVDDTKGIEGVQNISHVRFGNNGGSPALYGFGSPNAFDARENSRAMQRPIAVQPRRDRWTF